jgi:hypothetical protein
MKYLMFFTGGFEVNVFISSALDLSLLSTYKAQLIAELKFIWPINCFVGICGLCRNQ